MKITIETPQEGEEEEIIVRCRALDEELLKMLQVVKAKRSKVAVYSQNEISFLPPETIFYFEAVDSKVFVYCEKDVYEVRKKLYELEQEFEHTDFVRISKSIILNLAKISYLSPSFNGRFDAKLKNGEVVVISRQYVVAIKNKLGI